MRKIQVLGTAFVAVLVFGGAAVTTSYASEWQANGKAITSAKAATTKGTWKLLALSLFGFVETEVECTGALIGTVGPGAKDEIKEIEGSKKEKGTIECKVGSKKGGCTGSTVAHVTATNLPWETELLKGSAKPTDDFETPGFTVKCTLSGGSESSETCEGKAKSDELVNNSVFKGVEGSILNVLSEKCAKSGTVSHATAEKGQVTLTSGETLTVVN